MTWSDNHYPHIPLGWHFSGFDIYVMHRFGLLTFHRLQSYVTQWTEFYAKLSI
jgi:hypothetical protein